jgi:hypothetical protein
MVAGTLAGAGWYVGERPYAPRSSNPKGFFESSDVNGVNELLLSEVVPASERMGPWQRWLAWLPDDVECRTSPRVERVLARLCSQGPWCFKDPRLSYTLPVWRPHIGDAGLVCVFRDPAVTARSIVKECAQEEYLASLAMTEERAIAAWTAMYGRILGRHRREGDWLFLHYEQLLTEEGMRSLERFVGAPISRSFPEEALRRTQSDEPLSEASLAIYEELCGLARYPIAPRARRANPPARTASPRTAFLLALEQWVRERPTQRGSLARAVTRAELETLVRALPAGQGEPPADRESLDGRLPSVALWERCFDDACAYDLGPLEATGQRGTVDALVATALHALRELADIWQREERLAAFERELREPWPMETVAQRRWLAWPEWGSDALAALLTSLRAQLSGSAAPALILRHDAELDGPQAAALSALEQAYERVFPNGEAVEVVLLGEPLRREELVRVGLAVEAVLVPIAESDSRRRAWLLATGAPRRDIGQP